MAKFDLSQIHEKVDLKDATVEEMIDLSQQIRTFLVDAVTEKGGHLASNLGVVELTAALHAVFDLPTDRLIFDVGHQSYVHKILSGRKDDFSTLRDGCGLCGFTNRKESPYDPFGAGHSSTSVSAAIGFAQADRLCGRENYTIAVFGDGAFTGGMIHEALNNCPKNAHLILILNENEMSISRNIGRYSKHLARIRTSKRYFQTKQATEGLLRHIPLLGKFFCRVAVKIKEGIKHLLSDSNYFEELGLHYMGPVDGHDLPRLLDVLQEAKRSKVTTVIHVKTKKGMGYSPAMESPGKYHGLAPANAVIPSHSFSENCGRILTELANKEEKVCAITAAMCDGTGLTPFLQTHPQRFFDVGIAEEHAITFAAGLCAGGMRPFVAVYSTFLQRGYDQLIHDVALQSLPVTLMIDRAGLNLHDGATHHGIFDVSFLSAIPGMQVYAPLSYASMEHAMEEALQGDFPTAIRYESGGENREVLAELSCAPNPLTFCSDAPAQDAAPHLILTYGRITKEALRAKELLKQQGVLCTVVVLECLKPLDPVLLQLDPYLDRAETVLFLEEGIRNGGTGQIVGDLLQRKGRKLPYTVLAIEDTFVEKMPGGIYAAAGISAEDAVQAVLEQMG